VLVLIGLLRRDGERFSNGDEAAHYLVKGKPSYIGGTHEICRLGLMLFAAPARTLAAARDALRPGGKVAVVVFTTPVANRFMSQSMQILLRHAGKTPPAPGQPGIFALGAPGTLGRLLQDSGFADIEQRAMAVSLRVPSTEQALTMMQEAFGASRAVVSDCSESVRATAWAEVAELLETFKTSADLVAPAEVMVAAGVKPK
jgi:hypothetical protein